MDRFKWLNCQPWLSIADDAVAAVAVDWFFDGFASFYTCPLPHQQHEALSDNAAHLFFSVQPPSTSVDPAQLTLKLGMIQQGSRCINRDVVLAFENTGSYYILDFKQVVSVSTWRQEEGCKVCKESNDVSGGGSSDNTCACQLLPAYVTVRLKHVSLIIYPKKSNSQTFGVMDVFCKAFQEGRGLNFPDMEKGGSTPSVIELTGSLNSILGSSKQILQQFLTRLDCMSECAVGAVDVYHADVPQMARILHILMEHAMEHQECNSQLKSMQYQLQSCLKALEDEKETHFSSIWTTTQQEVKVGAVAALQHTLEQKKKLEEAILWMELINPDSVF
ncbi:hypothetical protein L7F22_008304 [Adiantum nelumboides]|nr:hypothetical protein [Adiantum nelumboides]